MVSLHIRLQWIAALLLSAATVWFSLDFPFFWDTIQLASRQADFFYRHQWSLWLLPDEIDSGHPPFFGFYLSLWWAAGGRSLAVSHWAMFPALLLVYFQLFRLCRGLLPDRRSWWLALPVVLHPFWLGQSVLVSPDVILLGALLLGLNGLRAGRRWQTGIAVVLLSLISLRGMMMAAALGLTDIYRLWQETGRLGGTWQKWFRRVLPYLPGGLLAALYLGSHFAAKGWIGYHADSPWAPSFTGVSGAGWLRQWLIYGWRLVDHGQLFVWLGLVFLLLTRGQALRQRLRQDYDAGLLAVATVSVLLVLSLPLLTHAGLLNHRYLLPFSVCFTLLFFYLLLQAPAGRRRLVYALVLTGLASGSFWSYPAGIARGWDATPAHIPWYRLRAAAMEELHHRGIAAEQVGAVFPEIGPVDDRDLSGSEAVFPSADLSRHEYVLYSNIMNDWTDAQRDTLAGWQQVWLAKSGMVRVAILKKPE